VAFPAFPAPDQDSPLAFIEVPELPLPSSGKLDLKLVRDLAVERAHAVSA
jgi:hypothetical protein